MKITIRQLRRIILESLAVDQITLYSFVPKEDVNLIKQYGLAGTRGLIQNEELLDQAYPDEKERQEFIARYDENDVTLQGPSVFFQRVPMEYIVSLDDDHLLSRKEYVLISIDWSSLTRDFPDAHIDGLELIPYDEDEYEDKKGEIERELSDDEVASFSRVSYSNAWENYVPGYFAGNVPHGIVMLRDGIIPPEYLDI